MCDDFHLPANKNLELFNKMQIGKTLVKDSFPGIYHVKGLTNLPFPDRH